MDDFLQRLAPRPSDYGGLPGKITREDDAGNVYDETGRRIFNKFDQTEQPDSWLDTAISTATAPAKLATALVGSLNPYGQDGWQVPPIVSEGADALTAVGDAYTGKMAPEDINSRALGMASFMMGGGGLAARPAGGTGMFAGRLAKTADHEALARAEKMAAEGADRRAIWDQTGWFKGPDQKWRFEIDDSKAYADVSEGIADGWKPNERWPLGHVLGHKDAFAAYPSLDNAGIQYRQFPQSYKDAIGSYAQSGDQIVLNSLHRGFGDDKAGLSAILHEGQHRIQSAEGFARGGNRGVFTPEEIAAERARVNTPETNDWSSVGGGYGDAPDTDVALGLYKRLAGETEARNVQTRMNMSADQRRATPPWETQDIPDADQIVRLYSNASKEASVPGIGAALVPDESGLLDLNRIRHLSRNGEQLYSNSDSRPALLAGALGQEQDIPDWLLPFLGK